MLTVLVLAAACSNVKFGQNADSNSNGSTSQQLSSGAVNGINSNNETGDSGSGPAATKDLNFGGFITGVQSATDPNAFETSAPRGTTVQLQYSIKNAVSMGFQLFSKGADTNNNANLALGEDGQPYGFAQYANLEFKDGSYVFNLPLKVRNQYLPVGDYVMAIWPCSGNTFSSCKKFEISFSVSAAK